MTDAAKTVVNKYAYLPYGKIFSQEELIEQPFTFAGMVGIMEEVQGLYYMRARYYDPSVGRFISEDPSGFVDGPNLYAYVSGSPLMFVDPLGLCKKKWQGAFSDSFWQETYINNVFPIENMVNQAAQGVGEWSDGVNWQTVGIGGAQIYAGGTMIAQGVAVSVVTSGAGTTVGAWQGYVGVMTSASGVINVIIGLNGEKNYEAQVADTMKNNPAGQSLSNFFDMY